MDHDLPRGVNLEIAEVVYITLHGIRVGSSCPATAARTLSATTTSPVGAPAARSQRNRMPVGFQYSAMGSELRI